MGRLTNLPSFMEDETGYYHLDKDSSLISVLYQINSIKKANICIKFNFNIIPSCLRVVDLSRVQQFPLVRCFCGTLVVRRWFREPKCSETI
jgi:hypothetical protein